MKKEFMPVMNIKGKKKNISKRKMMKKQYMNGINIKHNIPIIPGKVVIRSEEDIIKQMCSYRKKGNVVQDHMKDLNYVSTLTYEHVKKELNYIHADVIFNCTIENENLFELLLKGIWMKIKADRYIKKKRIQK